MTKVQVRELVFEKFIGVGEINAAVQKIADDINRDYAGKNPLLLAMLNGAFIFASDLMRKITIPCEITFTKYKSYSGTSTTSKVNELIGLNEEIKGRHVIIVEDIVDTGITMEKLLADIRKKEPLDVKIACFCFKPDAFQKTFSIDYLGMRIPNDFIVGYGLDYDGYGRNLPDIYKITK
ncbi:MAG: hypoxanthine phosphoribosyltransferase [Bacteroidales bacterium]|nr:hypoxanthine phosphoribosyltransferase [Bacteroidales bacterium]MDD4602257.1 hypoxanthine phosphoribosyltransferase [Bacteroidales bacterium]